MKLDFTLMFSLATKQKSGQLCQLGQSPRGPKVSSLIKVANLLPRCGKSKIKLYSKLFSLPKPGTEPKNEYLQAESEGVQMTMVAGAGFAQDTAISIFDMVLVAEEGLEPPTRGL